jgi:hypothetical protein
MAALQEAMDKIRGSVMILFPMGLPEWDLVRAVLEDHEDLTQFGDAKEVMDPETATLWWAAKELVRDKMVSDFLGRNEKTKIIAKLQKAHALWPCCVFVVLTCPCLFRPVAGRRCVSRRWTPRARRT